MKILAYNWHTLTSDQNGWAGGPNKNYYVETPMSLFWFLVFSPYYREANEFGEEVEWLIYQGIHFTVEYETKDELYRGIGRCYEYYEGIRYWITIPNEDDAMMFKLRWGGK